MDMYLQYTAKVVAFHPYRKAWVKNTTMVVQSHDVFKSMQDALVKNAIENGIKAQYDNHTVFETEGGISFAFSDWKIYIGVGSQPR